MYYSREQHQRFLDKVLSTISENYLAHINSSARALLEKNEVFVTKYIGRHSDGKKEKDEGTYKPVIGQMILRFKKDMGIPRRNDYYTAVLLEEDYCLPKKWGNITWGELCKHQVEFSEVHCVWQGKEDDAGFLICGFSGLSLEMAERLKNNNGCVIVLGPQKPPMEYYQNLIALVSNEDKEMPARQILDFDKARVRWNPKQINSDKSQVDEILEALNTMDEIVFQGPPGTGKTYLMAEMAARLLQEGRSVLVTALTNRALMEIAGKESLANHLKNGEILKTNLSADEKAECKDLIAIDSKEITCMPGKLTLTTFYNSSGWAKSRYYERPFDYVIMDEASQALLGMIAACKNLGSKVLWIGDQNQMQPIVNIGEEEIERNNYHYLVSGFQALCDNFDIPSYILTRTHRLLPKAAELTSTFYHVPLISSTNFEYLFKDVDVEYIPSWGGTVLLPYKMPVGEKADSKACDFAIRIVDDILKVCPKIDVSLLSKFRKTVRMLQNRFISKYGSKNNVLIDTVERIQGMTCDVCIYFVPNAMMGMSLERSLFNVATSRAKQLTIIISDDSIKNVVCNADVKKYIETITSGNSPRPRQTPEQNELNGNSKNLVVKGHVDLLQFETPKQKAVKSPTKENIYIIDTNVFVDAPGIISKVDSKSKVVLSAKVIDELDKLKIKLGAKQKHNVEDALRHINYYMDRENVTMELSDPALLPKDFNRNSPDNNILTVALKFKDQNPILLTSDNGLQVKAKGLHISTISLKEFLKR